MTESKTIRKVLFITGTRADYGKLKPLMKALQEVKGFEVYIYVCGMHLLDRFGGTYSEVLKDGYENVYVAYGLGQTQSMSMNLGDTIRGLAGYVGAMRPDMIVVHGDRTDALAGAVVGALDNILVAHVEGGELSGTIDESTRHAISKYAHIHFACNDEAARRLLQLGEEPSRVFVIGSADIDVMLDGSLPSLDEVRTRYAIPFVEYGVLMYHPVTTEIGSARESARQVVDAVMESGLNYVVIYPNNDLGCDEILSEYERFQGDARFRLFPSMRFEFFLALLKSAQFIVGNSSAGIRESGVYGIPAIDIGTRQSGRYSLDDARNVQHVDLDACAIREAIAHVSDYRNEVFLYGRGHSAEEFCKVLCRDDVWMLPVQKRFLDHAIG